MRASLLLDSDPAAAARRASSILLESPGHPEANLLLAAACRKFGDAAAAATVLESLAAAQRDTPFLQLELGRAYAAGGRAAQALEAFRRAVTLDPGLADAWRELAAIFFATGDTQAGDEADLRYRRLIPDHPPELADALGALADNRLEVAEGVLHGRLGHAPDDVVALRMLAAVANKRHDPVAAERWLNQCLAIAPGYALARHDLAQLLYREYRNFEVVPLADRLLATEPHNIDYLNLKAQALRLINRIDEAIALMQRAVAEHPDDDEAWILLGHSLRGAGEQARAIEMYRRAISIRPNSGPAYSCLANLKTFRFSDADVAAMQGRLEDGSLRKSDRIHFEFALGKALEDQRQFRESFEHYARGNALHRASINHEPVFMDDIERAKRIFTASFFAERRGWGSDREDPIFVVGLPRSGSTLIEQILASHSQVEGTRELNDLPAVAKALITRQDASSPSDYLQTNAEVSADEIEAYAGRYLERTRAHRISDKPRFVDKMLGNFAHIGLIHLMFPRASIIDARRHPLGCGFSCYKQLFAREMSFAYDLSEIGRYYQAYAEFMAHLDSVLPGRVHRVYYERLVADPQTEIERMLEYCGLPFEPQCLQFYENRRVVLTISSEQVRQPIYSGSVDQWRHYEAWLGPLKDALGPAIERYPA